MNAISRLDARRFRYLVCGPVPYCRRVRNAISTDAAGNVDWNGSRGGDGGRMH